MTIPYSTWKGYGDNDLVEDKEMMPNHLGSLGLNANLLRCHYSTVHSVVGYKEEVVKVYLYCDLLKILY